MGAVLALAIVGVGGVRSAALVDAAAVAVAGTVLAATVLVAWKASRGAPIDGWFAVATVFAGLAGALYPTHGLTYLVASALAVGALLMAALEAHRARMLEAKPTGSHVEGT